MQVTDSENEDSYQLMGQAVTTVRELIFSDGQEIKLPLSNTDNDAVHSDLQESNSRVLHTFCKHFRNDVYLCFVKL